MSDLRSRDFPISLGRLPTGPRNTITDVSGVQVGHYTLDEGNVHTGATVIMPGVGNPFTNKYTAAAYVQNGFGKTCGISQIEELGSLETPIALTNTLNVGKVSDALNQYILAICEADGTDVRSINPVVGECNDSRLNDIGKRPIGYDEVKAAIDSSGTTFDQGDVGAGRSTVCFGFKGGIGSASRQIVLDGQTYTVGVLVQSNFGATEDFVLNGQPVGRWWIDRRENEAAISECDQGSIMVVVATDLPVNSRQLQRIIRRAGVGIMRTGAYVGHGSGEVMIGFTTVNRIPLKGPVFRTETVICDSELNPAFLAVAEATYEAILNSMIAAKAAKSESGEVYESLAHVLKLYNEQAT
ncbi:MAG: P1 family peptidase [Veillonella sp.]|uniref:P1 family peptidase n=1 Tax=Veillonella sp. TaxID=1926307 RepID=UPI002600AE2E|nr:P1 family peptidase [Veillonella sp.]MBS4913487.1 P1 family peptidase [Veillonella sp.]